MASRVGEPLRTSDILDIKAEGVAAKNRICGNGGTSASAVQGVAVSLLSVNLAFECEKGRCRVAAPFN